MISVHFQGQPFNITVIQLCAPTTDAEEANVDQFYEDLQHLLNLLAKKKKKDILFITDDWNAKVESQEIPRIIDKLGLLQNTGQNKVQNKAGQKLTEFCLENTLIISNKLFQQPKRQLYI